MDAWQLSNSTENVPCSTKHKRMRISKGGEDLGNTANPMIVNDKGKHSDQFSAAELQEISNPSKYGSVTGILEELISLEKQMLRPRFLTFPTLSCVYLKSLENKSKTVEPVVIIDSDDEEPDQGPLPIFGTLLPKTNEENDISDIAMEQTSEGSVQINEVNPQATEIQFTESTGVCVQEEARRIEKEDDCPDNMVVQTSESSFWRSIVNSGAAEIKLQENQDIATYNLENLENETHGGNTAAVEISIIDSDDEDPDQRSLPIFGALLPKSDEENDINDITEEDQRIEKEDDHLNDIVTQTSESTVLKSIVNGQAAEIKIAQTSESSVQSGQAVEYQCTKSKGVCAIVQAEEQRVEKEDDHLDDIVAHTLDSSVLRSMVNGRAAEIEVRKDKGVYVGVGEHQEAEKEDHYLHTITTHIADNSVRRSEVNSPDAEIQVSKGKGIYIGVEEEDQQSEKEDDGLNDLWREMNMAEEYSKEVNDEEPSHDDHTAEVGDCDHSFILKDDIGYVCRICGIIDQGIDTIFEFQYNKGKWNTRTYMYEPRYSKDKGSFEFARVKYAEDDLSTTEISAHPRHMKQMKPHQVEGFKFLASNLVADSPGGCIMAHAPGSGKTFMIISFVQSFLGKYPQAKPLVILPKGILGTWKKEFQTWQVESLLLLDFYSARADNRKQQYEVLKQWVEERSILFLGYKQFSSIVCDSGTEISSACQEMLLKVPTILILDEGHTPRNQDTDVLQSLARVQTPRKVVLSGTLYQNHVKEVFNILNLVRPKFLKLETSRVVYKRIMSRVDITGIRKHINSGAETAFYELVEHTLQNDEDFKRKVAVIKDLREMTSRVLQYYKGDSLDELPGLIDLTVVLNLSLRQKEKLDKLKKHERKFKMNSIGSSLYLHPELVSLSETPNANNEKIDKMLEHLDLRDGAKANFFLNLLNLCVSADEKLLVFSQYLLPLKFLERLVVKTKSWSLGREVFVITGDSSSENREWSMERFNSSPDAKVFFGSIKACGEGISLVGASRIIILDVHLNPSVTRQAIGRAFRPGQTKMVYVYRLVANGSPEEEDHATCFRKELISKLWFEWNEYCGFHDFTMETSSVETCGDLFLESPLLREGIISVHKR